MIQMILRKTETWLDHHLQDPVPAEKLEFGFQVHLWHYLFQISIKYNAWMCIHFFCHSDFALPPPPNLTLDPPKPQVVGQCPTGPMTNLTLEVWYKMFLYCQIILELPSTWNFKYTFSSVTKGGHAFNVTYQFL